MIESGEKDVKSLHNDYTSYKNAEYKYYGTWMIIGINLPEMVGKQKRINITLPNILID